MSKPVLLSGGNGKVSELAGTTNNDVLTWDATLDGGSWKSAAGGSGTVTSVGLTGGTSGIVVGGTASPITSSGTYNLDAPLKFSWNTATPTAVSAAGDVAWNADAGTLDLMFAGGNVQSTLGQTLHQQVLNDTGATLTKGQAVYVNGAQGNRVTVALAQADADSTSATIIGIIAHAIADEAEGYVITEGVIKGVNTGGYTEGAPVYLSPTTPGALTQTKPQAPQHLVLVGYCVKADATTGEILVKTQNGYELDELHDVYINSPASGQLLIYDATVGQTRWENASLTAGSNIAITNGPGSISIGVTAIPYDLPCEIPGTPPTSTKVVNFKAVRAFSLSATGHQGGQLTPPSGNFVCTVAKNGTSIGTITFAAGGFSSSITATSFAAGDVLSVETPAAALDIDTPFFTLAMTLA